MLTLNSRYKKSDDIVSRKIADESILVPIRDKVADLQSIYTLNEVAAFIWELIDGKKALGQIKEAVTKEFEVKSQEAEKDVLGFIRQMEEIKAVEAL